ncbi:unnamed protein product [Cylicocyclus nassatus]|uniref:Uncharacterized protein n=1 Tax=Cylicocyclus nassatus TaxID=53992 RepID=A0AA36MD16_CYLNA|nr:unnamed protein product [Cylicocyclus nassatus]
MQNRRTVPFYLCCAQKWTTVTCAIESKPRKKDRSPPQTVPSQKAQPEGVPFASPTGKKELGEQSSPGGSLKEREPPGELCLPVLEEPLKQSLPLGFPEEGELLKRGLSAVLAKRENHASDSSTGEERASHHRSSFTARNEPSRSESEEARGPGPLSRTKEEVRIS